MFYSLFLCNCIVLIFFEICGEIVFKFSSTRLGTCVVKCHIDSWGIKRKNNHSRSTQISLENMKAQL